jgi:lipid-A-disaccharide synthase
MKPKTFMLIAGEASGDLLGAELVTAIRAEFAAEPAIETPDYQPLSTGLEPRFFGAGGPHMAAAGVELAFDMTDHAVLGLSDVLKNLLKFRRLLKQLQRLAREREPDAIICVDFAGFNLRFAKSIRNYVRGHQDWFHDWNPKIIQYVSPQVWASREHRAYNLARDHDLLLSTFSFEKAWYAKRVPQLKVEFVGNPILDRHAEAVAREHNIASLDGTPTIVLLPGSRRSELRRHVPLVVEVAKRIGAKQNARFKMVFPNPSLVDYAKTLIGTSEITFQAGDLDQVLAGAELAITKSGTITLECACFGVPAVVFYKTSAFNYLIGRQLVTVRHIAMPNLLANEEIFPEFIQGVATPERIAQAALELLQDEPRRQRIQTKLAEIVGGLGGGGASQRAARAIVRLVQNAA